MSETLKNALKALPLGLLLPIVIGAASVKPDDAMSNLSEWAHFFGIHSVPDWLAAPTADSKVVVASLLLALAYSGVMWGPSLLKKRRKEPISQQINSINETLDMNETRSVLQDETRSSQQEVLDGPNIDNRIFVKLKPEKLMKMTEGKTALAITPIIAPYVGKWIELSGLLKDLDRLKSVGTIFIVTLQKTKSDYIKQYLLLFAGRWQSRIEIIEQGQRVKAVGKIRSISPHSIVIEECELVLD